MTIGEKIKIIRKKNRLTQKELGDKLGVSYQMIAQYENGKRNPKIETVQKIADALDMSKMGNLALLIKYMKELGRRHSNLSRFENKKYIKKLQKCRK